MLGFKRQEEDHVLLSWITARTRLALLLLTLCLFSPPQSRCGCGSGERGECGAARQPLSRNLCGVREYRGYIGTL